MKPVNDNTDLIQIYVELFELESKEILTNRDLMTLMEIEERKMILTLAKEVCNNLPQEAKEINEHYKLYVYLLEKMAFVTATDLRETAKKEPKMTGYECLCNITDSTRFRLFNDLKQRVIHDPESYGIAVRKSLKPCLDVWTSFRDTIHPFETKLMENEITA